MENSRARQDHDGLVLQLQAAYQRNLAATSIGKIKGFSSLNLLKHRLPINGFLHILAAIAACQINPLKPRLKLPSTYLLAIPA